MAYTFGEAVEYAIRQLRRLEEKNLLEKPKYRTRRDNEEALEALQAGSNEMMSTHDGQVFLNGGEGCYESGCDDCYDNPADFAGDEADMTDNEIRELLR